MTNRSPRLQLFVGIVLTVALAAIGLGMLRSRQAAAQESVAGSAEAPADGNRSTGTLWLASAEPPADHSGLHFSPPDRPAAPEEITAPDAVVSWRVAGSALRPRENDVSYSVSGSGGCTYVTAGDANSVWNVTPALENGAEVRRLQIFYNDTSSSNSSAWFTVYDAFGTIVEEWSVSTSGDGGEGTQAVQGINHVVDFSRYSYLINWRPGVVGSQIQLCGFRLYYEQAPFGAAWLPAVISSP